MEQGLDKLAGGHGGPLIGRSQASCKRVQGGIFLSKLRGIGKKCIWMPVAEEKEIEAILGKITKTEIQG